MKKASLMKSKMICKKDLVLMRSTKTIRKLEIIVITEENTVRQSVSQSVSQFFIDAP